MSIPKWQRRRMLAFQFRHATKRFDATKMITDDDIKFILETAHLSTKFFGFEPWHFIVVQDPTLRELIKPVAWLL
jgi:nitroreductase